MPRMLFMAVVRAVCAADGPRAALSETTPLLDTEYCVVVPPTSKVFDPASEMHIESTSLFPFFGLYVSIMSAHRPPQPVVGGRSGMDVCHCTCWSACEKSCGGNATELAVYCALGTG